MITPRGAVRSARRDRGSAALETAIVAPGLLLVLATLLQAAWWYMARSAAHAAAAEGVRTARSTTGTVGQGQQAALAFARGVGRGQLLQPAADTAGSTPALITITVTGRAPTFLPGFDLRVSQTVTAPKERFVPGGGGP